MQTEGDRRLANSGETTGNGREPRAAVPPRLATRRNKPTWRKAFDAGERMLAPWMEDFVRTEFFASGVATLTRVEARMRRQAERNLRRLWHLWNLPTATDVRTLSERMAVLQRQVRELAEHLERDERLVGGPTL
jgi:hypothetical protein